MKEIEFPKNRTAWFEKARFGMFIHWGLYSILGRGEWVRNRECIPLDEYSQLAKNFTASNYDPKAWAKLAVDSGMKYVVLTAKHHEGFCLWDSKTCKFNSVNSGAKRDLLAEYVEAMRSAGLKVGLYYSLADWYHPDSAKGMRDDAARERFMDYTYALVQELMTDYGHIDILWYDQPQPFQSPGLWRVAELNAMARFHQPHILINNRARTTEDFSTPEQHIAASAPGWLWESCMTLTDNSWGYCPSDHMKTPRDVVVTLATAAASGGNLLLNFAPDSQGEIPRESVQIIRRVGKWLDIHGESVYDSDRHKLTWGLWGQTTVKGNAVYLFLQRYHGKQVVVSTIANNICSASLLTTGQKLDVKKEGLRTIISGLPETPPDELMSVIKLEVEGEPCSPPLWTETGGAFGKMF